MIYTKEDLEQAYIEGYNSAYDELESMLEDSNNEYSLEDECNYYMESNEDNYTALEQAYLEMITKDDKETIRGVNRAMIDAGTDKSYRSNFNKMIAAVVSKKKDGSYTLNRDRSKKYVDKRFDRLINDKKMKDTENDKKYNDKYKHLGDRIDKIIRDRQAYDKQHKS